MKKKTPGGRLIVLEGGEGAGKSTHARFVHDWLARNGRQVVLTREPGGSPLAEAIREVVLRRWEEGMGPTTELLLMFAARAAHLRDTILPALEAGRDVVCDRFLDATYAYQGAGRGMPDAAIDALASLVLGKLRPHLVLLLDVDPRVGMARAQKRGAANRFDEETLAFQSRVRAAYLRRARRSRRYAVVDAGADVGAIQRELARVLAAL
ncbi:MAG TPA: dTMP kinase [Candidatus Binatia bacterium]|nr:dTMP kinase [Candidatus Binatia bacterium]